MTEWRANVIGREGWWCEKGRRSLAGLPFMRCARTAISASSLPIESLLPASSAQPSDAV